MSDRLAVFADGRIEQVGPPADVYEHPVNEFVAGFVGVSNIVERDGRRFTIRPEKVRILDDAERVERPPRGGGPHRRRLVRRDGHPLRGRAGPGRRASGRPPEPRDVLAGGARAEGSPGARRLARRARVRDPGLAGSDPRGGTKLIGCRRRRWLVFAVLTLALAAFTAAGCGDDDDDGGGGGGGDESAALQKVGKGEGQVNLIAWAGYVEDGSTDPNVDWVSDFEKETGCQVNVKIGNTSDEMVTLMRTGKYDGVSASGDATLRLIAGGDVDPVNTDLIPNYKDVFQGLKDQPHNTVDGVNYGVPHGRGANLLMFNKDVVKPAPDSWARRLGRRGEPALQGQDHRVRQPDLHRGRGALPEGDPARPRDRQRLRARRQAVPGGRRPAEAAARGDRRVLVRLHEGAGRLHVRRHGGRHDVAGDREPRPGATRSRRRSRRSCRRRARPGGPTPG